MQEKDESTVIEFLDLVWRNTNDAIGHSWMRLNHSMHDALMLAVKAGFKFEKEDFTEISKRFRFGYWGGAGSGENGFAESFYTAAVRNDNRSACIAFEAYKKRKPFIYGNDNGARVRLAIGSDLKWTDCPIEEFVKPDWQENFIKNEYRTLRVEVSSFGAGGEYLNAMWFEKPYEARKAGKGPDRRFRITHEDLKVMAKVFWPKAEKQKEETAETDTEATEQ